jgi:kinase
MSSSELLLPPELGKHSRLYSVDVEDNKLTGAIPEGLCAGGLLQWLHVSSNRLNGSILKKDLVDT